MDADDIRRREYTGPGDRADSDAEPAPLPGDPREAQEPQEPRSTHVASGHGDDEDREAAPRPIRTPPRRGRSRKNKGVVDELREAWDRVRGRR